MKRINWLIGAIVLVLAATFAFAHHGPKEVTFTDVAKKQPAVTFDHATHSTKLADSCDTCHHTNKGMTAKTDKDVKPCRACHLNPKDDAPSMSEMSPTKNPMHVTCMGCHKEQKKGPVKCNECHVK